MIEKTITLRKCHIGYSLWISTMLLTCIALPLAINNMNTAHIEDGMIMQPHELCYTDYFTHIKKCDYGEGDGTFWQTAVGSLVLYLIGGNLVCGLWLSHNKKWFRLNIKIKSCEQQNSASVKQ